MEYIIYLLLIAQLVSLFFIWRFRRDYLAWKRACLDSWNNQAGKAFDISKIALKAGIVIALIMIVKKLTLKNPNECALIDD